MKRFFLSVLTCLVAIFSFGQIVPTTCEAPDSVKMKYLADAKILAVRSMQFSSFQDSIKIPAFLIEQRLGQLLAVYNGFGLAARDTVVDCLDIHAKPEYTLNSILCGINPDEPWIANFLNGITPAGNAQADLLIDSFHLEVTDYLDPIQVIEVTAGTDLNTAALALQFEQLPGVSYAETNHIAGDGNDIQFETPAIDTFIILKYSYGWGDCPAGCISRRTWEFHLPNCDELDFAGSYGNELEEGVCDGLNAAHFPLIFEKFEITPSPADEFCSIKITARTNIAAQFYLVNLPGQILMSQEIQLQPGQDTQAFFETGHLPDGLYFLTLQFDNQHFTKKIIIHHR